MDSDDEIFLTQNTFSQEFFSPELNLEELLGDFREVSERDSVEVEKKEYTGRNIVVVCDNEVEKRRESRIPANTKVNTEIQVYGWRYDTYKYRSFTIRVKEETVIRSFSFVSYFYFDC